jgi:hypothetical protein
MLFIYEKFNEIILLILFTLTTRSTFRVRESISKICVFGIACEIATKRGGPRYSSIKSVTCALQRHTRAIVLRFTR